MTIIMSANGHRFNVTAGGRIDTAVSLLHDILTTYECNTRDEILTCSAGAFSNIPEVDMALEWIRDPAIAAYYGWTVPHVPRGRPQVGQTYRYFILTVGQPVTQEDTLRQLVGGMSVCRSMETSTSRLAYACRTSALTQLSKNKKMFTQWAEVLEGISAQAALQHGHFTTEAERIVATL